MMNDSLITPAFVVDEKVLLQSLSRLTNLASQAKCYILYSPKACSVYGVLELISDHVQGFACSSLFEAKLSRTVLDDGGTIHITTPGLRQDEIGLIGDLCDYVTFNSLSQWERFKDELGPRVQCGLRVNPMLSLVRDERYDPCRKHSKLGVSLEHLIEIQENVPARLDGISGLHFHTNCDSTDFSELLSTVRQVEARLKPLLERVDWVNVGGGYLFDEAENLDAFHESVELLCSKYDVEVFSEPGAAIVRKAGSIVSSVVDMFSSDGKTVAVLDTTVNHMPEIFEFQFEPDVDGDTEEGRYRYILAGSTCLAGDVFGEYAFNTPLEVGSLVVFTNAGAYTMVLAHMFNGVNLPTIYSRTASGELVLKKRFTFDDFANRCGVDTRVTA